MNKLSQEDALSQYIHDGGDYAKVSLWQLWAPVIVGFMLGLAIGAGVAMKVMS